MADISSSNLNYPPVLSSKPTFSHPVDTTPLNIPTTLISSAIDLRLGYKPAEGSDLQQVPVVFTKRYTAESHVLMLRCFLESV